LGVRLPFFNIVAALLNCIRSEYSLDCSPKGQACADSV
jgi:hypothetical protein